MPPRPRKIGPRNRPKTAAERIAAGMRKGVARRKRADLLKCRKTKAVSLFCSKTPSEKRFLNRIAKTGSLDKRGRALLLSAIKRADTAPKALSEYNKFYKQEYGNLPKGLSFAQKSRQMAAKWASFKASGFAKSADRQRARLKGVRGATIPKKKRARVMVQDLEFSEDMSDIDIGGD